MIDLYQYQTELSKRWQWKYQWGRRQEDDWDKITNFVYRIFSFEQMLENAYMTLENYPNAEAMLGYALNRWYNFHSAKAVEYIFQQYNAIKAEANDKHKYRDFFLEGIAFDHKTTIFPQKYPHSISYAQAQPQHLAEWLYKNQSQQQRLHYANRLFVVLYDELGEHWKLKARLDLIQQAVETFVHNFKTEQLFRLQFKHLSEQAALSQIIWVEEKL